MFALEVQVGSEGRTVIFETRGGDGVGKTRLPAFSCDQPRQKALDFIGSCKCRASRKGVLRGIPAVNPATRVLPWGRAV